MYRELYRASELPVLQNRVFQQYDDAIACTRGDVVLVQNQQTGLIFNQAFNADLVEYDAEYQNEQGISRAFQTHLNDVTNIITKYLDDSTLIEVGCGKGAFLEHLQTKGFDITGLDPVYEGANPSIIKEFFTPETGLHADGIILRHVLEHIPDPVSFLMNICQSNGGSGKIYIEVPCLEWICEHCSWFDIFYEHVNYFRLDDFSRMFGHVYESGHIFGGQYIYVVADIASIQKPIAKDTDNFTFPSDFLGSVENFSDRLSADQNQKRQTLIWGGASKGVIFSLFMQRAGMDIDLVVDINPAKQDKYLPVTGLKVYSPEDAMNQLDGLIDVIVMNSNYLSEIKQLTDHKFNYITVEQ